MLGILPQYIKLKVEVLKEAGILYSLEQLKEHFSSVINSRRALSKVKSLTCIIRLLEEREILNWSNVDSLLQLGYLLQSNKIQEYVQSYRKLYLDEIDENQCICGAQLSFQTDNSPLSQQLQNQCHIQNNNNIRSGLNEALINVSQRIGKVWPYLARELKIRECHIDRISDMYPDNFNLQAKEALCLWLEREKENATVEILNNALNARHCKRFGIGSYLLEPM